MNPSGKVKFIYVVGNNLPEEIDNAAIYIVGTAAKSIYVGSTLIVSDLSADFDTLRTYIENYLGSQDFIDDIGEALQAMVDSGQFTTLLTPIVTQKLPGVVADQIAAPTATAASAWLAAHVDPQSQVVIDDSLTIQGAAADAKAAGDGISQLKSALNDTNLFPSVYTYTALSGYQNVPCTLTAGTYLANNNTSSAVNFRDSENNTISGISISGNANKQTLTITAEKASQIAYIRLYQQTVKIWKTPDIVNRVTTLESAVTNKANASDLYWKADAEANYTDCEITLENGAINTNGTVNTTSSNFRHAIVSVNGGEKYMADGLDINASFPFIAIFDGDGNLLDKPYTGTSGHVVGFKFTTPQNAASMYVNFDYSNSYGLKNGTPMTVEHSITKVKNEVNSLAYFTEKCRRKALYQFSKYQNEFAWGSLPKGFISWMNDDCRNDLYLYKDLCDTYGIPYANAVPYESSLYTREMDGEPLVDYLKGIISDGGEIFAHGNTPLTSSSTENDFYNQFFVAKKTLEDALESDINGIIQTGGSGYSSVDYDKCQEFALSYFEYSDYYGTSPQYTIGRTRLQRSAYSSDDEQIQAFKDAIDDAVQNHKWLRLWCHGTDEVSITVLTAVFEYAKTYMDLGTLQAVTWKYMYDTYGNA